MNMNLSELINEILVEWAYRIDDGQPNPNNPKHISELSLVLSEMGLGEIKHELIQTLTEADSKQFKNPALNKEIPYKDKDNKPATGIVGNLLRLPKDHPGRKAAEAMLPPEGSEERDSMNKDLGSEKDGRSTGGEQPGGEKPKDGEAGGEQPKEDPIKAAAAMFDPKADPAMGARLDREKKTLDKLAQKDKESEKSDADAEKATSTETPEGEYPPISEPPPANEKGEVDSDGKIAGTEIEVESGLDEVPKSFLEKISTKMGDWYNHFKDDRLQAEEKAMKVFGYTQQDVNRLSKDKDSAEFKAYDDEVKKNQEPTFNLCSISIPGTNLFCDGNKGITRDKMPQFKGKPEEGSQAWNELEAGKKSGKYKETDTEVEGEPFFRQLLADKDIKVTDAQIAADSLKATQSELVGDKVMGMKSVLDKGPDHPAFKKITAPIFVSKDGYVVDGHHRWAAITAHNIENPDNPLPMNVMIIDKDIDEAIDISNEFASNFGVAAKSGKQTGPQSGENPEPPKDEPSRPDTTPPTGDETDTKTIKGKTSGKEIKTIEFDGGGQVYGTQHTNTEMVDDIIDDIKSKIPKEKWKDIVFVGEGGATNKETGELEFNDEMDYAVPKFKEMGAGVDTFDGDDLDVHEPESKLYKKQIEKTGLTQSQVNAGNWASMIGQGEGTDTMKPTKFLGEDGKQFLQDAAKEAGLPEIENFDNPTGDAPSEENDWKGTGDRGTLYRLSFPNDNGDTPTKINDIQVAFNEIRDENIIEKNKELTAQGKIPITIAGEGHIDLLSKKQKEQNKAEKPEEKLPEPKQANEKPGGVIYSIGGGYYSDTPDGPAQYITAEGIIEKVLIEGDESLAYLLFEAVVNKVTAKGKKVRVQTIDPKQQKKATAKAAAASEEQPVDEPKSKGKKKKEKQFPKGYIAPTVTPSQVEDGLNSGDLTALTECNDNLLHNRDIGVSGMGGPVASYGEAGLCRTANSLRERGYEGFIDDNAEAVNAKMMQIKEKKSKFQSAINEVANQLGFTLPEEEEAVIEYLAARMVFGEQEFQRLSSNPDSIWTKEGKQGFGSDRDAFNAWSKAMFDGALSTKDLIETESLIDTTKPYVVIQSNTVEGEGHDIGILNHLKGRLEKAKQSGNQEDIQHYSEEVNAFEKLGFHDTMAVGFDKNGRTCVFSITNKKQDNLADIWGNTTPAYMLNIIKKQFDPKVAIKVVKVIDAGIADVSDAKMATNREFANFKIDSNFLKVLETPELKKYTTALKQEKNFNAWLKEKMGKKYPPTKLLAWMTYAQNYVQSQLDAGQNPSYEKFGKLLTKVGELGQKSTYIRKYQDNIKFNSAGIQAAVDNKNSEKELTAKVHKNVVKAIESADKALKTWPGKEKGINGPHKKAYLTTVMHSMHLDLMISNYDKRLGAITGIRGTTSADFRNCMSELSGFKPNSKKSEAENREALNKHLVERCTLDPVSHAILIKNDKGTVTLAEDTWRTAGTSQKVEKKLGDGLRGCVSSKADARRKANRQAKK
jgi:hypothetical protein